MEHLVKAIEKLAKDYSLDPTTSFLGDVYNYLRSGDDKLMPRLLKLGEADMNRLGGVARAISRPDKFQESDRRLVHFFIRRSALLNGVDNGKQYGECSDWPLARCLEQYLVNEKAGEDFCSEMRAVVLASGVPEERWVLMVARHVEPRVVEGRLTSAGRYLVTRPTAQLVQVMPALRYHCSDQVFMPAFAAEFPDALKAVMDGLIREQKCDELPRGGWVAALNQDPASFESRVVTAFEIMHSGEEKIALSAAFENYFPGKYLQQAIQAASNIGAGMGGDAHAATACWLIGKQGAEAVPAITEYIAKWNLNNQCIQGWKVSVLRESAKLLGQALKPALAAAMQKDLPELRFGALELWISLRNPADDAILEQQFLAELTSEDPKQLILFIPLASSWNLPKVAPRLWQLMEHRSKPVREAAAQALSRLGDAALPKALELLGARKMDLRKIAASLLGAVATPAAQAALRQHLASETSEDVRDLINKLTPKTKSAVPTDAETTSPETSASLKPDQKQIESAIAAAAKKIKVLPAAWIQLAQLPAMYFSDGKSLSEDGIRYLLYRQSREKEIVVEPEAALLLALVDRKRSGDFALALLNGYLNSELEAKDRWSLALAGLLGDDRLVPILSRKIDEWAEASRGKLAEYAVQALALLETDAALLAVDAMAIRYRTKFKNIGKAASQAFLGAAASRGISAAELGDRVVPWLGFEPGRPRIFAFGSNTIAVSIGLDFKLVWRDLTKDKPIKSLPASAPEDIKLQAKELSAGLKEAAKAQLLRMENLMVQQNRWEASRWAMLFLQHPLARPFSARLVWGVYGPEGTFRQSFRALEDRSLTDAQDEPFPMPADGHIGILHPLDAPATTILMWLKHLADYNVTPPFAQLERPIVRVKSEQKNTRVSNEFAQTELNAMTFKGRAERLGWARGSVCDGGGINHYFKPFPAAGVDVFVGCEGMYVGIDMYSDITLGNLFFVQHGSVQIGSYVYDEPGDEQDVRLVPFGEVAAIAFSEAMGDLSRIAGKDKSTTEETTEQ